jgi:ribosomal protein L29
MTRISEFKNQSEENLRKMLAERRIHLAGLRFSMERTKVKNVKEAANVRKDIARILTLLTAL